MHISINNKDLNFYLSYYLLMGISFLNLSEKANIKDKRKWLGFVPIVNDLLLLDMIDRSRKEFIWDIAFSISGLIFYVCDTFYKPIDKIFNCSSFNDILITIVLVICIFFIVIYYFKLFEWQVDLLHAFGFRALWAIMMFIGPSGLSLLQIVYLYIGLSEKVKYKLNCFVLYKR